MILSEREILRRLYLDEDLIVTPILNPPKQIGPTSIDLRLGTEFKIPRTSRHTHLEPRRPLPEIRREVERLTDTVRIGPTESFVLHPGEFALASTLEYICLPQRSLRALRVEALGAGLACKSIRQRDSWTQGLKVSSLLNCTTWVDCR